MRSDDEYLTASIDLSPTICPTCGMVFAVPTTFDRFRKAFSDVFYCPSGHQLAYGGGPLEAAQRRMVEAETGAEKMRLENVHLRDQLEALREQQQRYWSGLESRSAGEGASDAGH